MSYLLKPTAIQPLKAKRKGSPRGETNSADMVSPLDVSLGKKTSKTLLFFAIKMFTGH